MKVSNFFSVIADVLSAIFIAIVVLLLLLTPFLQKEEFNIFLVGGLISLVLIPVTIRLLFKQKLSNLQLVTIVLTLLWLSQQITDSL